MAAVHPVLFSLKRNIQPASDVFVEASAMKHVAYDMVA